MSLFNLDPKESTKELFGREKKLKEHVHLIKAKRWVAVLGSRMMDKTSLTKVANNELEKTKTKVVYVVL